MSPARRARAGSGSGDERRGTRQRAAIRDALAREERPLSPAEVLESARRAVPGLGIATVYRALRSLADAGVVVPVELPGVPTRWEMRRSRHHHHFQCRRCDRVFDAPGCVPELSAIVPRGFVLDGHDIVLYGKCDACVGRGAG